MIIHHEQESAVLQSISIMLFLCLSTCLVADDQPADGNVKCVKGKCGATFPGKPKLDADKTSDSYILGENDDKQGYVLTINYLRTKVDVSNADLVKKALDEGYRSLRNSLGAKATKTLGGTFGPDKLPYRYYEFDLADGGVYYSRVVLTGDRTVSATISGPKAWATGEKPQAFLKSLKVDSK